MFCVSCPEDKASLARLGKLGVPCMDKEWLLTGILRHKLDPSLTVQ